MSDLKLSYKTKIKVYKDTVDDWYPNFENNLVSVSIHPDNSYGNEWRLSVWGDDDFGLEKLYKTEDAVLTEFMQIISKETIKQSYLKECGFTTA